MYCQNCQQIMSCNDGVNYQPVLGSKGTWYETHYYFDCENQECKQKAIKKEFGWNEQRETKIVWMNGVDKN